MSKRSNTGSAGDFRESIPQRAVTIWTQFTARVIAVTERTDRPVGRCVLDGFGVGIVEDTSGGLVAECSPEASSAQPLKGAKFRDLDEQYVGIVGTEALSTVFKAIFTSQQAVALRLVLISTGTD